MPEPVITDPAEAAILHEMEAEIEAAILRAFTRLDALDDARNASPSRGEPLQQPSD